MLLFRVVYPLDPTTGVCTELFEPLILKGLGLLVPAVVPKYLKREALTRRCHLLDSGKSPIKSPIVALQSLVYIVTQIKANKLIAISNDRKNRTQ